MSEYKITEEFQAYCDENLIKPKNIYFQFWRDSKVRLNSEADAYLLMLEALENLENDSGQIPERAWDLCQQAIIAAGGRSK